ncbi:hypothetical protein DENSPDRAFT_885024 [Dentipellis sp. KUC8613]|nr:hypothetical protein DENSPDRAFT_885024 [Dentipellis sp. KUC8613]
MGADSKRAVKICVDELQRRRCTGWIRRRSHLRPCVLPLCRAREPPLARTGCLVPRGAVLRPGELYSLPPLRLCTRPTIFAPRRAASTPTALSRAAPRHFTHRHAPHCPPSRASRPLCVVTPLVPLSRVAPLPPSSHPFCAGLSHPRALRHALRATLHALRATWAVLRSVLHVINARHAVFVLMGRVVTHTAVFTSRRTPSAPQRTLCAQPRFRPPLSRRLCVPLPSAQRTACSQCSAVHSSRSVGPSHSLLHHFRTPTPPPHDRFERARHRFRTRRAPTCVPARNMHPIGPARPHTMPHCPGMAVSCLYAAVLRAEVTRPHVLARPRIVPISCLHAILWPVAVRRHRAHPHRRYAPQLDQQCCDCPTDALFAISRRTMPSRAPGRFMRALLTPSSRVAPHLRRHAL